MLSILADPTLVEKEIWYFCVMKSLSHKKYYKIKYVGICLNILIANFQDGKTIGAWTITSNKGIDGGTLVHSNQYQEPFYFFLYLNNIWYPQEKCMFFYDMLVFGDIFYLIAEYYASQKLFVTLVIWEAVVGCIYLCLFSNN